MAVSDLTNTTWVINEYPNVNLNDIIFYINFTSANQNWNRIRIDSDYSSGIGYGNQNQSGTLLVYENEITSWSNNAYKTITITGGTDVTNATLIAWLEANATQQTTSSGKTQIGNRAITKKMFGTREITKEVVNGIVVYEKATPSTITFYVEYTTPYTYTADSGMTWGQFCDSAYNTYYFHVQGSAVNCPDGTVYYSSDYYADAVSPTDVIEASHTYVASGGGN